MKHRSDMKCVLGYCFYGQVDHGFMSSCLSMFQYDAVGRVGEDGKKRGGKHHIVDGGGLMARSTALLVRARTELCQMFLDDHDADWLFMVDTDMTFEPDVVDRFIEAAHPVDRPIVGGLAFSYMRGKSREFFPTLYAPKPNGEAGFNRMTEYPGNQLIQVGATGAACLLVHRSVLKAMRDKYQGPRPWFSETILPPSEEMPNGDMLSEDLTFCLRAQACGFPIYVHTGIKFGHIKDFSADEERFIEECEKLSTPRRTTLPTFAVVASRNREDMLRRLYEQLVPQCEVLVFDNGYEKPPVPETYEATGLGLHEMWNWGLDEAEKRANGNPHNVLIVNDDIEIGPRSVAALEAALRSHATIGCAYPNPAVENGMAAEFVNEEMAGQTLTGWCFMLRGEDGFRFDEEFSWWYGDSDMEKQIRRRGKRVVGVGGVEIAHLDPLKSSMVPERLELAKADELKFARKWKLDPAELWLAKHPEFGT